MTWGIVFGFQYKGHYIFRLSGTGHSYYDVPMMNTSYSIDRIKDLFHNFSIDEIKANLQSIINTSNIKSCPYYYTTITYKNANENYIRPELNEMEINEQYEKVFHLYQTNPTPKTYLELDESWHNRMKTYNNRYHLKNQLQFQDIFNECKIIQFSPNKNTDLWVSTSSYNISDYMEQLHAYNNELHLYLYYNSACVFIDLDNNTVKIYKDNSRVNDAEFKELFPGVETENKEYSLQSISYEYIKSMPNYQHFQTHVVEELIKKSMHPSRFLQFCEL